jgi:hypothetical protein
MIDLATLRRHLEDLGNPLILKASDVELGPGLDALVDSMPGHQITLDVSAGGITIDGAMLTIAGTSADRWPVQGMPSSTLTLTDTTITVTETDIAGARLSAALPLARGEIASTTVVPGSEKATWRLALANDAFDVTPTELIAFGVGGPLPFPIPPQLNLLDQTVEVDTGAFEIHFAPNTTDRAYYAFAVRAPEASFHLIPKVIEFNGLRLGAVLTPPGWSVTIIGELTIGSTGMDLGMIVNSGPVWSAFVGPSDGPTFPGVIELARWIAAGGDLPTKTTEGFDNLDLDPSVFDLALSRVTLSFDVTTATVVSLVIVSRLTIVGLALDVVLTLPDLMIAGALAPPGNQRVVDMLAAADIDSSGVPDTLTITAANFLAEASIGRYSTDVAVEGIWPTGPLQLKKISLAVAYAKGASMTGSFRAELEVAGVGIEVGADYDGPPDGWTFLGRTLPGEKLRIGALIEDLGKKFGIEKVPEPIATLELTNLEARYTTGTGAFKFTCEAGFLVTETPVAVVVSIAVTRDGTPPPPLTNGAVRVHGTKGYSATFSGSVSFAGLRFDIVFDTDNTKTDVLIADYVHTGADAPVELRKLVADVSDKLAQTIPPGITIGLKDVKFVFLKQTEKQWAFGLRLGAQINLNELPLVGSKLPPDQTLAVEDLQILYSSDMLKAEQTKIINPLLPAGVSKLPEAVGKGISFGAAVRLGSERRLLEAGVKPPALPQALALTGGGPDADQIPPTSTDPVTWLQVDKQFGVFSFQRVGVGYVDNVLEFALDASVGVGPISFALQELTSGSPLTHFEPKFGLKGLALSFDRPPIQLGGAFLKVPEVVDGRKVTSYYGEVLVHVPAFGLTALGGWAPDVEPASFFIYLAIDAPLGGPPFLFVTGLAGGFGINSRLTLPTIDRVGEYPLLPKHAPAAKGSPAETIAKVIPALQGTFRSQAGQYWVAAGLAVSSFKMIDAQVVLSVSFGVDVQVGVVGTAAATLPTGSPYPAAYVQVDVVAAFTPWTGQLTIDGKLSPASYLFGGFVKLSGGFALYAWFSGDRRGDFVVSLGGYHPAYTKPPGYPDVPRLGIAFSVGPLKVIGQAYFALTPGALMAGIRLTATFEAGPIKAWFDAGVDFLIAWAPFHYQGGAWITIGCSVDLGLFTLSVQIGAELQIWGPAFGGSALVDLDIVSFTIDFGAPRSAPGPVGWRTLATNFLPSDKKAAVALAAGVLGDPQDEPPDVLKATITAGRRAIDAPGFDWVVDPDGFVIVTSSTVPANHAEWGTAEDKVDELPNLVADYHRAPSVRAMLAAGATVQTTPKDMYLRLDHDTKTFSKTEVWAPDLGVAPMDKPDVDSYHTIVLRRRNPRTGEFTEYVTNVTVTPQLAASNAALWGQPGATDEINSQRLVESTLLGMAISPAPRSPSAVNDVRLDSLIYGEGNETGSAYQSPTPDPRYGVKLTVSPDKRTMTVAVSGQHIASLPNEGYVLSALVDPWVSAQRTETLNELNRLGFATTHADKVSLTTMARTRLTDWPDAALIGSQT